MRIIKANGEEASYEPDKIERSLERAGASQEVIKEVISKTDIPKKPEKLIFDLVGLPLTLNPPASLNLFKLSCFGAGEA